MAPEPVVEVPAPVPELRLEAGSGVVEFIFITSSSINISGPAAEYVTQGFVSIDRGTGLSTLTIQTRDDAAIVFDPLWWTVTGAGLFLDLYGFGIPPDTVASTAQPLAIGLSGEDGVVMFLRILAPGATPPYPFIDRGGEDAVIITETGNWTNVNPDGPLTDSYTIRLAKASTATVYITITSAYGSGLPFVLFSSLSTAA